MSDSPHDRPTRSSSPGREIDGAIAERLKAGEPANRLIREKSPYLLQHAFNPVDWYPWGEEAFEAARSANKPIFLSVGYSTCYWCHVMEREVFEDSAIAALMNDLVISVKVDREERPDVDRIYMTAVQAMTGSGGWPMSVFLTPDLKPFYGATYIPPVAAHGRPGFPELLKKIDSVWKADPERIAGSGEKMLGFLRELDARSDARNDDPDGRIRAGELTANAARIYSSAYDSLHGGFGSAPKFPRPASLAFLFAHHRRTGDPRSLEMALGTLRAMAAGGMYDHLGGGFHRYSVDAEWHVPHFEKMLYDQAQLAVAYLDAYRLSGDAGFLRTAEETLGYVLRDLRDSSGGFHSAEDAESRPAPGENNVEGAYYVWTKGEILNALGAERDEAFSTVYDVRESGNARHDPLGAFRGKNILRISWSRADAARESRMDPARLGTLLAESRALLLDLRGRRPRPHLDDKILSGWNGLMLSAFAKGYQVTGKRVYIETASGIARFLDERMTDAGTGRLHRRYRNGEARFEGGLQDYAFVVQGLLDLYEATFDAADLRRAVALSETQKALFRDSAGGAWYDTPSGDPTLLVRLREEYDGAEPSGNSVTALNLFRLARLTDDARWRGFAEEIVRAIGGRISGRPDAAPLLLAASFWADADPMEIVVAGDPKDAATDALLAEIRRRYLPFSVMMLRPADGSPDPILPGFLSGLEPRDGAPLAYVCRNYACRLPTGDPARLGHLLDKELSDSIVPDSGR